MYDYNELIKLVPELTEHVKDGSFDYDNTKAVRLLNQVLLLKDFDLKVNLPEGHLCPTVPNRTAYIQQIEFLLYQIFKLPRETSITGIDIGTGVSCVYPLIGCSRNENWNFLATDIDDEIIKYARDNLNRNPKLMGRIQILKNPNFNTIFPKEITSNFVSSPKFVICNPPFYDDAADLESRRAFKRHKPVSSSWQMKTEEFGTELGGEVGFIKKMISESINLDPEIVLFSCMLGMKESLNQLLEHLKSDPNVKSFAYELLQISHTCRYLLFWSFRREFPRDATNFRLKITAKSKRIQSIKITKDDSENLIEVLGKYGTVTEIISSSPFSCTLLLIHNKWSRKYRRSPSTAPPLSHPISISIRRENDADLILEADEEADWEIFLGFVNHLRKEL